MPEKKEKVKEFIKENKNYFLAFAAIGITYYKGFKTGKIAGRKDLGRELINGKFHIELNVYDHP